MIQKAIRHLISEILSNVESPLYPIHSQVKLSQSINPGNSAWHRHVLGRRSFKYYHVLKLVKCKSLLRNSIRMKSWKKSFINGFHVWTLITDYDKGPTIGSTWKENCYKKWGYWIRSGFWFNSRSIVYSCIPQMLANPYNCPVFSLNKSISF